ncbi:MAG: TonB C-terminal domain-containing protein [Verrucomicrobia bacterium]|nr:TonB C-terminal domain-containing protein [Verrucomicrobiota bacterium]
MTRPPDRAKADRERAEARERERAEAESRRLAEIHGQRVNRLVTGLQQNLSSSTSVTVPGTGGATYASYSSYVDLIYRTAWAPLKPRETTEASASVLVRVVIARDGTVISSEIRRRSGNAALDQSVRATLDRVRTIGRPFPEGARDSQREFDIEFNLQSAGAAG